MTVVHHPHELLGRTVTINGVTGALAEYTERHGAAEHDGGKRFSALLVDADKQATVEFDSLADVLGLVPIPTPFLASRWQRCHTTRRTR